MRRGPAGTVAALAAAVCTPVLAVPADARPASCSNDRGTVVAVDFGHWGGPLLLGCGVDAASGYQLLHDAGFSTAGTARDGPAFMCRIGNPAFRHGSEYPTPQQDPCVVTPPDSAYWSYWTAGRSRNVWTYDRLGAMSDVPVAGGVEFWRFGGRAQRPDVTPNQLRARSHARTAPAPAAPAHGASSGSPAPAIAAAAIVIVLGGGAGWTVWRRRRTRS